MTQSELLEVLCEECGFDDPMELAEASMLDSICPAICKVCGYTTEMEPDQTRGWCEGCEANTVVSALILMGVI